VPDAVSYAESAVNRVKSYFITTLKSNETVGKIIAKFKREGRGTGARGIVEKHFFERMPATFEKFDRGTGQIISSGLELKPCRSHSYL